jgi:predicted Fe-Mo cluster-binding NifX family protein
MKICIPTETGLGLQAAIAGHLGRAPFLTLVDTETGGCEVVHKAPHAPHTCAPVDLLKGRVEAVVCNGAGRGAVAKLRAAGIPVLVTAATRVAEPVQAVRETALPTLSVADACGGHHEGEQRHGGGHCHGEERGGGQHRHRNRLA